ncbi:MAG: hypothetical protein ACPLRP_02160 [Candidatus Bipolaricaulaceae bacterium]
MRVKTLFLLGVFFGASVLGANMTLESSTFTPEPGGSVTLFVRGAPSGATFRWDLDGDGAYELTTAEPQATTTVPQGLRLVRVEVVVGKEGVAQFLAALVADARLGATRFVSHEDKSYLVTITVSCKTPIIAPGFVEDIPPGSTVEVVGEGGAFWRRAEKLEVVWPLILDPGQTVSFTYRLYPLAGAEIRFGGLVSAYVEGKRVEIPIAGAIRP